MAGVWLDGGTLYRDVVDTNPPLIVFLTAVPVWAARVLHLSEPQVFKAFVFVSAALSVVVSIRLIPRFTHSEWSRLLLAIVVVFLLFPFVKSDFGQREHLSVLLVMPFVLAACAWAAGRAAERGVDAAAGVLAGLGFAMKPHFLLAWIGIELCLVGMQPRGRSWMRPAAISAAASVLVYAAVVLVFVPEYLSVARDVQQMYGALNSPPAVLLRLPDVEIWLVAAIALAVVNLPPARRATCVVIFATATGFLLAALLQLKGWTYHLYPFRAFVVLLFATMIVGVVESHPAVVATIRGGRRSLTAAALAAMALWSVRYVAEAWRPVAPELVTPLVALVRQQAPPAESLGMLTMRAIVYPAFPVVNYAPTKWVLRHHSLWFLPGLYADELQKANGEPAFRTIGQMTSLERRYFEQIVEDLCARPPRMLIVEPPIPKAPPGRRALDLVAYYRQDSRFDHLFTAYSPIATVGSFTVFSRQAPVSCQWSQSAVRP